jgi:transcription elongation GreA/GreB family factor
MPYHVARWSTVAALSVLFTLPLAATSANPARPTNPAVRVAHPEPHPQITAAIRSLERAKDHLEKAAHDFGGHRVEAIQAIDAAIAQLKVCLQYDKK